MGDAEIAAYAICLLSGNAELLEVLRCVAWYVCLDQSGGLLMAGALNGP